MGPLANLARTEKVQCIITEDTASLRYNSRGADDGGGGLELVWTHSLSALERDVVLTCRELDLGVGEPE